jgi:hypothetical protein
MRSGGDALSASVHSANSVDVHNAARDVREQFRCVEARNVFSAISSVFQITAVAFSVPGGRADRRGRRVEGRRRAKEG